MTNTFSRWNQLIENYKAQQAVNRKPGESKPQEPKATSNHERSKKESKDKDT